MAIVQNPITGRTKKAFGTAVFSKQFGKNTMRTKPIEVRNPKTEGQVTQRTKFSTTVALVRQVLPIINEAYAGSLTKMSPFNKVTSINVKNAFIGEPPVLDHSKVVLCDNVGSTVSSVHVIGEADQLMKLNWEPNTVNEDELNSLMSFVIFNCTTNEGLVFRDVSSRASGSCSFTVPVSWVGAETAVHVVTKDYVQLLSRKPKFIIKFAPGNELSNHVR